MCVCTRAVVPWVGRFTVWNDRLGVLSGTMTTGTVTDIIADSHRGAAE